MVNILIKLIRLYQVTPLSTHMYCRYSPRCSDYMIECLKTYGLFKGLYLGIKRIIRCNPLGSYGYDPVPRKEIK